MAYTGNTPALTEFWFEDFALTYLISGSPVYADVGKAVTLDVTAAGTVKLAGAGDVIVGQLDTLTFRTQEGVTTCGVARKFIAGLPILAGLAGAQIPTVGCTLEGAGNGFVRAMTTPNWALNFVRFTDGTTAITEVL